MQSEWSLFSRDIEAQVVPAARELGVALVPYSPLGRGFLTGSFVNADKDLTTGDFRRQQPRFTGENAAANQTLLEPIRAVAEARGASLGQIALAWVQQQAAVHGLPVIPIPGTRKPSRVDENLAATHLELTKEQLELLEPIAAQVAAGTPTCGSLPPDGSSTPGRGEPRDQRRRPAPDGEPQSSASNSAFFTENSSSVTSPAWCSSPR
ncbi:hypothetical protein SALBM311S_08556 [Streptomyces alboniger]